MKLGAFHSVWRAASATRSDSFSVTSGFSLVMAVSSRAILRPAGAGIADIGESRVQETAEKAPRVRAPVRWHLVGHLQGNKARHAVGVFELIHSLDDLELAREIDKRAGARGIVQAVLVQANLSLEATNSGPF